MSADTPRNDAGETSSNGGPPWLGWVLAAAVILVMLFVLGAPGFSSHGGCANVVNGDRGANVHATTAGMADLRTKLDLYDQQEGKYPSSLDDLVSTKNKTSNRAFLGESPTDGWNERYVYTPKDGGTDYELRSLGKDHAKGGSGLASDIVATSTQKPTVENPD